MDPQRPLDALSESKNKRIVLELKNGKQLIGLLRASDIHINTVLDEAEEYIDGQLKRKIGRVFVRGDMIILISPAP